MAIGFLVERGYPAQLPLAWLAGWLAGWLVHRGSPALWMGGCCLFGEAGRAVVPSQIQVQLYGFHYKSTPTARLLYRYTVEPLEPLTFNPHFHDPLYHSFPFALATLLVILLGLRDACLHKGKENIANVFFNLDHCQSPELRANRKILCRSSRTIRLVLRFDESPWRALTTPFTYPTRLR